MKLHSFISMLFLSFSLFSCSEDEGDPTNNEDPIVSVEDITIDIQHIVTPIDGQPAARYMKFNMLNDKIYFQELSGSPHNADARLWEYSIITNQYTLTDARGTSFSWSGWGTKLFNLNGLMFHIDPTSEPYVEYLSGNEWQAVQTAIPDQIAGSDATVSGDIVYFLGGDFSNSFTAYRSPNEWFNMASFPIPTESPALTSDENYVYSIGGWETENAPSAQNYFARYSIENNQWEQLEDLPNQASGSNYGNKALIIKDRFLVVLSSNDSNSSLLDIYDIQENVWKTEALSLNLPVPYIYQHNDTIYIISTSYNSQTELVTCNLYKAALENLPN